MKNINELEVWYDEHFDIFKKLVDKAQNIINDSIKENNIQINSISGRVKEKDSFCEKALKDKYNDPINEITDMAGIRIIAYVNSDVDKISKIIENEFDVDKENSVDKGKLLGVDKVGYKSVHYILKLNDDRTKLTEYKNFKNMFFEVQIRTLLQHAWSEIEHDRNYKFSGVLPEPVKREFALLAGTLELVDMHFESISKKIDDYSKEMKIKFQNSGKNDLHLIELNNPSIIEYMKNRFNEEIDKKYIIPKLTSESIINELKKIGINNIKELDDLLSIRMNLEFNKNKDFSHVLRLFMLKKDYNKYTTLNRDVILNSIIYKESIKLYKANDIDVEKMISDFNMSIFDN